MTNSQFLHDQSRLLAHRLWDEVGVAGSDAAAREEAFITAAFEQVLSRAPSEQERVVCREFQQKQVRLLREGKVAEEPKRRAREGFVRALFNHDDFITLR